MDMENEVVMCIWYSTSGHPDFKPVCVKRHYASLKCHSRREDCRDYAGRRYAPFNIKGGNE